MSLIAFSAIASVKSVRFVETKASMACVSTSSPASAVTFGGTLITSSAFSTAEVGSKLSSTIGYLTFFL